ncbi:MAG: hypothetical protein M3441_25310 [Chloroflexota bacterium]|jgi:hypothetical protein|nr:hypothetical protein [Chloroflexota bacterium]
MFRPEPSIPDNLDVLSIVRNHLSRHPECQEWDAYDLAKVLGLCEMEVQFALEALTTEDGLLP